MSPDKRWHPAGTPKTPPARPYSSPACFIQEAESTYLGYMSDGELVEFLNALLESERAGKKMAQASLAASPSAAATSFLDGVRRDQARHGAMMIRFIRKLGGSPSRRVGAFYDEAMAIEGLAERLTFLNCNQRRYVRRLKELLPRIRDDLIHSALKAMLGAHEAKVARCEALITSLR